MIVVKLQGGLGNQMFQYAFAKNLSLRTGIPFALDAIALEKGEGVTRRHYSLHVYTIEPHLLTETESLDFCKTARYIKEDESRAYTDMVPFIQGDTYFEGYWQNHSYFKEHEDTVRSDFTLKNPLTPKGAEFQQLIDKSEGIAVQVRRGDYVTNAKVNSIFHVCDADYFRAGIERCAVGLSHPHLFITSDDITWCKKNLKLDYSTTYISESRLPDYEEIFLLSRAQHTVISNSSFGWWIAWLNPNPNKVIVAPKQWLKKDTATTREITPPSWIRI